MRQHAAAPLADLSEKEWQSQMVQLAQQLGWRKAFHVYDSRRSHSGFPDLVLVRERVLFAELKSETGTVSAAQRDWLGALLDADAEVYLLRPRHLEPLAGVLATRACDDVNRHPARLELMSDLRRELGR